MHAWTAAPAALAALAALCLVCVARCPAAAAPGGAVAERQALQGADIESKDLPEWWLPLFSPVEASALDGHLCGFAVRLGRSFFLAHTKAVGRILELQSSTGKVAGMIQFRPATTIDLNSPLTRDSAYVPALMDTFKPDFGLYKTLIRPGHEADALPVDARYPMDTSVCLQSDGAVKPTNCRLITYGDDLIGGAGPSPNGTRRLKMVGVVDMGCEGPICFMKTASAGRLEGLLCGVYANLGNPIICGVGPLEKITYVVWAMGYKNVDPSVSADDWTCTNQFRAVKVAHISEKVWTAHTGYMRSQAAPVTSAARLTG